MAIKCGDGADLSATGFLGGGSDPSELAGIINGLRIISISGYGTRVPVVNTRFLLEVPTLAWQPGIERSSPASDVRLSDFEVTHLYNSSIAYGRLVSRVGVFTRTHEDGSTDSGQAFVMETTTSEERSGQPLIGRMRIHWVKTVTIAGPP